MTRQPSPVDAERRAVLQWGPADAAALAKNAQNLLIIRDPTLVAQYTQNWEAHRQHS
jgi:hypothetical protein